MARWLLPGRVALLAVAVAGAAMIAFTLCGVRASEPGVPAGEAVVDAVDDAVQAVEQAVGTDLAPDAVPPPLSPADVIRAWYDRIASFDIRAIADDPDRMAEARLATLDAVRDLADDSVVADFARAANGVAPAVTPTALGEEQWFERPAVTPLNTGGYVLVEQSAEITRIEEIGAAPNIRTYRVTTVARHVARGPGGAESSVDTVTAAEFVTVRGADGQWRIGHIAVIAQRCVLSPSPC